MFFGQLDKFFPELKRYVFVDEADKSIPENCEIITYNVQQKYSDQFLSCIKQVREEFCIYIAEDYILYDIPRIDLIKEYQEVLRKNSYISFIRFTKGLEFGEPLFREGKNLYVMSNVFPYFYSNTAALWRTRDLERIHVQGPNLDIGGNDMSQQFEPLATQICQHLNIQGLYAYHEESKRGLYHYDSIIFPYIATALVKGKWNLSEYKKELNPLLKQYNIDENIRGVY